MQRRVGSKQAISNEVQHSCIVKRSLEFQVEIKDHVEDCNAEGGDVDLPAT